LPVLQLAPFLNGLLFSGTIVLTSIIINGYQKKSHLYKFLLLSVLVCSPGLLEVYSMLWSETLFIFLSLLFIITVRAYTTTHRNIHLVSMGIVTALALVTRYAGITLLVVGACMLLFDGSLAARKKIKHLVVFGLISISLALINLIRNSLVAEHLAGVREKALRTLGDNINQVSAVFAEWFPFTGDIQQLR
jgi:4-amino-4-deoxy-L-arabinose transferase-like glycosyltransferase